MGKVTDPLSYPAIQIRAIMREITFPVQPSTNTIFNFGVMAFEKAIGICVAALVDKQRRTLFDLSNAKAANDQERVDMLNAQYESYRLMIFDFNRLRNVKEEVRVA